MFFLISTFSSLGINIPYRNIFSVQWNRNQDHPPKLYTHIYVYNYIQLYIYTHICTHTQTHTYIYTKYNVRNLASETPAKREAAFFTATARRPRTRHLDLSWNQLGPSGAFSLASQLPKMHLKQLDLSSNQLEERGQFDRWKLLEDPNSKSLGLRICGTEMLMRSMWYRMNRSRESLSWQWQPKSFRCQLGADRDRLLAPKPLQWRWQRTAISCHWISAGTPWVMRRHLETVCGCLW